MKTLDLVAGVSLGLMMAGCPGDDGGDEGADSGNADSGATSAMTTDQTDPPGTTGEPPDTTTTGEPPGTSSTTGDPPDDTTGGLEPCVPPDTTGVGAMSFEQEVWPIIEASCLGLPGSCHDPGSGGLSMLDAAGAYANLVDVASAQSGLVRIAPGCPDHSYLWAKVNGEQSNVGGMGGQMPLGGAPLPPESLDIIEQWILNSAQP